MELKRLNERELMELYRSEMMRDFPAAELKPLGAMLRLMEMGQYDPLMIWEGGQAVGYAMVWLPKTRDGALLEYLGVLRGMRNAGVGSRVLPLLLHRYGQLFGEVEAPNSGDEKENLVRRKRIEFYKRNGFRLLDYQCALFGVQFRCMYAGTQQDDRVVETLHRSVYADYFSPEHMQQYIQLPLQPGESIHPAQAWVEEVDPRDYERKVDI